MNRLDKRAEECQPCLSYTLTSLSHGPLESNNTVPISQIRKVTLGHLGGYQLPLPDKWLGRNSKCV